MAGIAAMCRGHSDHVHFAGYQSCNYCGFRPAGCPLVARACRAGSAAGASTGSGCCAGIALHHHGGSAGRNRPARIRPPRRSPAIVVALFQTMKPRRDWAPLRRPPGGSPRASHSLGASGIIAVCVTSVSLRSVCFPSSSVSAGRPAGTWDVCAARVTLCVGRRSPDARHQNQWIGSRGMRRLSGDGGADGSGHG